MQVKRDAEPNRCHARRTGDELVLHPPLLGNYRRTADDEREKECDYAEREQWPGPS